MTSNVPDIAPGFWRARADVMHRHDPVHAQVWCPLVRGMKRAGQMGDCGRQVLTTAHIFRQRGNDAGPYRTKAQLRDFNAR